MRGALALWHSTWRASILEGGDNPDPDANLPVLYKDRALVWLYLAGIFSIPDCKIASSRQGRRLPGTMPVCSFIQRLIFFLDSGQLEALGQDFAAIHNLVVSGMRECGQQVSIGSLMYREPDAFTPGFS